MGIIIISVMNGMKTSRAKGPDTFEIHSIPRNFQKQMKSIPTSNIDNRNQKDEDKADHPLQPLVENYSGINVVNHQDHKHRLVCNVNNNRSMSTDKAHKIAKSPLHPAD